MPPAKSSFSCCGDRDGGEMFGRRLEFWRAPVYYATDAIAGVPVTSEYKGYKLETVDMVVGEKRNMRTEKKPLMIDLNIPPPLF
ncbi:hypothetical protein QN277_027843 [Acacia crassicarpa]|uniref:Uncharacterized protein n=1 Tax=Acacia crassicarpa TaxID=499986 RepID=A0AAE1J483_9FABA|nr:hypothetical protein QN277_027843 [Acacia crassicarpa]